MRLLLRIRSLFGRFLQLMKAILTLLFSGSVSTSQPLDELAIVPFLDDNERLYRRIPAALLRGGKIEAAAFSFRKPEPDEEPSGLSFNRSTMSQPTDVLKDSRKPGALVAAVVVRKVPNELVSASVRFTFQVEHKPIVGNRSHSEIRAYDEAGVFHAYPLDDGIRKLFRERLALVAFPVEVTQN